MRKWTHFSGLILLIKGAEISRGILKALFSKRVIFPLRKRYLENIEYFENIQLHRHFRDLSKSALNRALDFLYQICLVTILCVFNFSKICSAPQVIPGRKWSPDQKWSPNWTPNDPEPQKIPMGTVNDPVGKLGMAWNLFLGTWFQFLT